MMKATPPATDTEVVIIGAGPVGLALAVELGWRGVACVVIESRSRGSARFPTANHISVRVMEHLRRLGLADEVAAAFPSDWGGDWVGVTHIGGFEIARVEDALAARTASDDSPEREVWAPKPYFDPILANAAHAFESVRLRYDTHFESLEERPDSVVCFARDHSGAPVRIEAGVVVGCDGAASALRDALEIEMLGPPAPPIVVQSVFFRSRLVTQRVPRGGVLYSLLGRPDGPSKTPIGAGMLVCVDGVELWRVHGPGFDSADPAVTLAALHRLGAEDAEILMQTGWTPRQAIAETFRRGRGFLAGDAAHLVTPFGGLGVNFGMGDAFDLGWKIAATRDGWGGRELLGRSYEIERRGAALDLLHYQGLEFEDGVPRSFASSLPIHDIPTDALWQDGAEGDAARSRFGEELERSRGNEFHKPGLDLGLRCDGSPIICDDASATIDRSDVRQYEPTTRPGGRAPHARLSGGGSTLDLFGHGFVLLVTEPAFDAARFEAAAQSRSLPLRVARVPEVRSRYGAKAVLVRPDGVVAWREGGAPIDAAAILDVVRGAPPRHRGAT